MSEIGRNTPCPCGSGKTYPECCQKFHRGQEAVDAVQVQPYDLILMDVQMPEMDGLEATRQIRAQAGPNQSTYIIALTANAMTGDREAYLAAGMSDYVSKPIEQGDLLRRADHNSTGQSE